VGLLSLAGWVFAVDVLKSGWPGLVQIKANTAVCLILLGVALWLRKAETKETRARIVLAQLMAGLVAAIGLASFGEYLLGWDLRIDQFLFVESADAIGSIRPGLMAPLNAVNFLLLGLALTFLDWTTPSRFWPSQWLSFIAGLLALFNLLDFILAPTEYHTHTSLPAALALAVYSLAVICARPGLAYGADSGIEDSIFQRWFFQGLVAERASPLRYGGAVALAVAAAILRQAMERSFGGVPAFFTFYPAILLAAVLGGLGPGIFATALSSTIAAYFFLDPPGIGVGKLSDVVLLAFFSVTGVGISVLAETLNRTQTRSAERLRKASLYARSLIEASLDPLVTISAGGKISDVNKATEKATGVSRSDLIGTDFASYFTEPEKARAGYRQVFERGQVTDYPLALRHLSGKITDVLYNASLYRDESGAVAGVFAAARDITERKRQQRDLELSEERFHSLVSATAQIVWTTDAKGEVVVDMPSWRDFTGRSFEQLRGTGWLADVDSADRERTVAAWSEAVRDRKFYETEYRLLRRDGQYREMSVRGVPVLETDGTLREWVGTCTDITERKRAEQELAVYHQHLEDLVAQRTGELQTTNKRLEGANQELETFAYSVSHDLRTPLRAVDGFSRILLEDYASKLDAEGQRVVSVIREGTRKMAQMIDDILAFSRAGRLELSIRAIDMEELVREALKTLEPALAGSSVKVEIQRLPGSQGDGPMIRRLWTNLLDNAIKFTRTKPAGVVQVGAQAGDNETIYYVKDNGVGFDMQYGHKLFGVFQRLHGPEEFPGTGIGLAIVKRIAERHGGRVWAEGKVGEGATIYFALPRGRTP
jgi:PAS domain S-box-containing protein